MKTREAIGLGGIGGGVDQCPQRAGQLAAIFLGRAEAAFNAPVGAAKACVLAMKQDA